VEHATDIARSQCILEGGLQDSYKVSRLKHSISLIFYNLGVAARRRAVDVNGLAVES
jgi:hypothetical protein